LLAFIVNMKAKIPFQYTLLVDMTTKWNIRKQKFLQHWASSKENKYPASIAFMITNFTGNATGETNASIISWIENPKAMAVTFTGIM